MLKRSITETLKFVLFACLILLACVPAVFLNDAVGYVPALMLLAALLLSFLALWRTGRGICVQQAGAEAVCQRGESITITLRVSNRSIFSCTGAKARVFISDLFGAMDNFRYVNFTLGGKSEMELAFDIDMPHVGCCQVGIDRVEIADFFGIFRKKVSVDGHFEVLVCPKVRSMEELAMSRELTSEANTETKVSVVGGTDYTGVRPYALGDAMKQIHWKLSAHSREYVTKLQESNRRQEYAVVLDFAAVDVPTRQLLDMNDCLTETALSIVSELSGTDVGCSLYYCDKNGGVSCCASAANEDTAELVKSFAPINPTPDGNFTDGAALLRQEEQTVSRGSSVAVITSRITEEMVQVLLSVKQQHRSPMLYCIVPAEWSQKRVEEACMALRGLDEAEIPCFILSTAVNSQTSQ